MTTIKVIRKFRGNTPRFVKQNNRSKGWVENYNRNLGKFSEIKRRKDLTSRQHNILGHIPVILRLKIPANEGHIHSQETYVSEQMGHVRNKPLTATQHEFFSEGVMTGGYGRKDPMRHSGIRQLPFGMQTKQTMSAFNPVQKGSKSVTGNTVSIRKGANRRARRGWTW